MSNSKHARGIEVGDDTPVKRRKTVAAHPTPSRAGSYTEVLLKFDSEVGHTKINKDTSGKAYELFFQLVQFVCDDVNASSPFAPEIVHIVCGYANPFEYAFRLRATFCNNWRVYSFAMDEAVDEFYAYATAHPDLPQLVDEVAALSQIQAEEGHIQFKTESGRIAAVQQTRLSPEFYRMALGDGRADSHAKARLINKAITNRNLPLLVWYESVNPVGAQDACLRSIEEISRVYTENADAVPLKEWLILMRRASFIDLYSVHGLYMLLFNVYPRLKDTMAILTSENGAYLPLVHTIADPDTTAFPPKLVNACQQYLKLVADTPIDDAAVQRIINTLS